MMVKLKYVSSVELVNKIKTHFKISFHSGCSPDLALRLAWILHGSSMIHAFGPSSFKICLSAKLTFTADKEYSTSSTSSLTCLRLRPL